MSCYLKRGLAATLLCFCPFASAQDERGAAEPITRADPRLAAGQIAPILEGLGDRHFEVTTDDPMAQQFVNQGLRLAYAFNHSEALRAFNEAARRDPNCAMAYWGKALVLGPNINRPMTPDAVPEAYEALRNALELRGRVTSREQAYIDALATRYVEDVLPERRKQDLEYAAAMKALTVQYPDDMDAATLYASALMNLSPWNYWTSDGHPRARTEEIVATLEYILERTPNHPGAIHYYIHAVEASQQPERAVAPAERLGALMPGAGHVVHMPSHIFVRVGRYADASESNARAIKADVQYIAQCSAQGIYPLRYYPHNIHFFAWTSGIEGRSADSITAAKELAEQARPGDLEDKNMRAASQDFTVFPLYALTHFGKWDEILDYPEPEDEFLFLRGIWRYARGIAYTARGELKKAHAELQELENVAAEPAAKGLTIRRQSSDRFLELAAEVLGGEIAAKKGKYDEAVLKLSRAVRLQDGFRYSEPPGWYFPVRQALGAILLEAGSPGEAETVYWEDLRRSPENGWSLFGLLQALDRQGKDDLAGEVRARFESAWVNADFTLQASRVLY